ncbi:MAG: hypothetical protein HY289_16690 [Planctomycetes bacterium]|nr:hypothetical protein [Planctomycetota bacterium]
MLVLSPIRELVAIALPWPARRTDGLSLVRWCLHALLWTSLVAGLWYLNRTGGFDRLLRSPWPTLHRTWLPLLGVSAYLLVWLSRELWVALRRDPAVSPFPEIDAAWEEACTALTRADVDVGRAPLFLMLGAGSADTRPALDVLGAVAMLPRPGGPIHVLAKPDGIFVVCAGVAPADGGRLEYLCGLLTRDRRERLPIQGIVLAVPTTALQADALARQAIETAQGELRALRAATGLEVPLHVAVVGADLDDIGASSLRFPPVPDVDPAEAPTMIQSGMDELCLQQAGRSVLAQFRVDADADNDRLFRALSALRAVRRRLGRLLIEGTRNDVSDPGMIAGCYFLPARDPKSAVQSLWSDLRAHQHTAAWTAEAAAAQARRRRNAWIARGLAVLGICASLALAGCVVALRWQR